MESTSNALITSRDENFREDFIQGLKCHETIEALQSARTNKDGSAKLFLSCVGVFFLK